MTAHPLDHPGCYRSKRGDPGAWPALDCREDISLYWGETKRAFAVLPRGRTERRDGDKRD